MRIGIIDLGTNSVRFDVQWIGSNHKARLLHREKVMVRLGQGVFLRQRLDPSAKRRTIEALLNFRKIATRFKTSKIIAFGTSALRDAVDGDLFVEQVKKRTGIEIRVISGEEEARLIALAILKHEKKPQGLFGLVDMGGGSTEVSLCRDSTLLQSSSFQLGTARLQQVYLKSLPPLVTKTQQIESIQSLRQEIRSTITSQIQKQEWPPIPIVIGSSGTIRAIERILKRQYGTEGIERSQIETLIQTMTGCSRPELMKIPGMDAKRVEMILAGTILLEEQMAFLGAHSLRTTRYSLRDGILDREILLLTHSGGVESRFQLDELYQKAAQFGLSKASLQAKVRTASEIFSKTQRLHQLDQDWLRYLCAGVILHEIGSAVSPTHFEAHSYYIVRNADFLAMENWETEWIAQLCLKASLARLSKKDLSFIQQKKQKQIFLQLLALMRITEALGGASSTHSKVKKLTIRKQGTRITLNGRGSKDLTVLRVQQRKALFEEVFKTTLTIQA